MTRQNNDIVIVDGATKLEVRDIDDTPSSELTRDAQSHALESSLTTHQLIGASQEVLRRVMAMKILAAVNNSHRASDNIATLRNAFASRRAGTMYALAQTKAALDDVISEIETHLDDDVLIDNDDDMLFGDDDGY